MCDSNMVSSLITCITSALAAIGWDCNHYGLVIGLMNMKAMLLCLRMLGIDDDVDADADEDADDDAMGWLCMLKARVLCSTTSRDDVHQLDLFSRIRDVVERIDVQKVQNVRVALEFRRRLLWGPGPYDWLWRIAVEVHELAKEVDDKLLNQSRSSSSSPLKLDNVVGIVQCILDQVLDFLSFARYIVKVKELGFNRCELKLQGGAMDALEVEITLLKHFLVFATRTGVEHEALQNVLIHTRPFVIDAVRVFMKGDALRHTDVYPKWIGSIESKCSTAAAIDPQVYQAYAQALKTSMLSSMVIKYGPALNMDDDIFEALSNLLDSLISVLWDMLRRLDSRKHQVKVLYERLRLSRTVLKQRPISLDQIGGLVCDAAVMLFSSIHERDVRMSDQELSELLQRFDVAQANVQTNPSGTSEFSFHKPHELGFSDSTSNNVAHGNEKVTSSAPQAVGFQDEEVNSVVDRLTRGSKHLRIVPIVGMAGLGKTTFAFQLYNHPSVKYHFHIRAWCPISQVLDKRRVFFSLLNQIQPVSSTSNLNEHELADVLRKSLKGKRYLILLDDVWTHEVWNTLNGVFPDDSTISRVIITSRHHGVAHCGLVADGEPYFLRAREVNECLEILQAKLFLVKGCCPLALNELGMKFAENCKGLPLTAVIVAGLLATTEERGWKGILDSISSGGLSGEEQCNSALELSFKHLPDDLKLCFLYFGAFPEDEEVTVKRLIRLWMAEGFVRKSESKRKEDVARDCMDKLVERSLVTVAKIRSIGGIKTCRMHDLLHDFCQTKAKQGNFFHLLLQSLDQLSDFNEPCNLQRLSIHSDPLHFQKSRLFCPSAHTLLFFSFQLAAVEDYHTFHISYIIQIYKLLKVLDIGQIVIDTEIPCEITLLTRLTYLSVQCWMVVIPSTIGNLSNLETLIANFLSYGHISFPRSLWNLQKLKYLHIGCREDGFTLPYGNIENSPMLLELETLSGAVFNADESMESQMRKFPNIRKLSCCILPSVEDMVGFNKIVVFSDFFQLESLTMKGNGRLQCGTGSTENLRKLNLHGFDLLREDIAVIGRAPNLEVLKLEKICYEGGTLRMEEGEFSKLRYLKLHDHYGHLKSWVSSDDEQLPLQKVVLVSCTHLEELPSCLDTTPTFEEIELYGCSQTLESLVRGIEEAQKDWGNEIKVHINQ